MFNSGGNYNNTTNAGVFYSNGNNNSRTNTNTNIGFRSALPRPNRQKSGGHGFRSSSKEAKDSFSVPFRVKSKTVAVSPAVEETAGLEPFRWLISCASLQVEKSKAEPPRN